MIFFLYGPDTYRSRQKFRELKKKFLTDVDQSALNLTILDGGKLKIEEFNSAIATPPFLARKRMVIVTDLLTQNKDKGINQQVIELLDKENLLKEIILIFLESDKVDQRSALFKRLAKEKYAQKFDLLKDPELKNWLNLEIKQRGGKISSAALVKFIELAGNDLWEVNSEIDKLIAYKNQQTIELTDVEKLVKSKFDDNIFNFVDAIANKNKKLAHKLLTDQLNSGANELYLLAMLIRQFRILLQVKDLMAGQFMNKQQIAGQIGLHPFVAQKAIYQIKNFSSKKLRQIYRQLLATDVKIKTNYATPQVLFDLLLINIMD